MEFNINRGATLNILRMSLIQDGRHNFEEFYERIQNADIYFSMIDAISGIKKISNRPAELSIDVSDSINEKYSLTYQFNEKETSIAGRYIGLFTIIFLDDSGKLIVPITETLYINVLDSGIKK